tara:strand:- start:1579 stop:3708 length:2130 start_codon:yes stop_codon:yes gene_type:complete
MKVLNRSGVLEDVSFDKVLERISSLSGGLSVDSTVVAQRVLRGLRDGISTSAIDVFSAEVSASMALTHPDYNALAARITVSDLHRNTPDTFSGAMSRLGLFPNIGVRFDDLIVHARDFEYDYLGMRTLERAYLLRDENGIVERPQYMLMRVALHLNPDDPHKTYDALSRGLYTHATPTLFNAGTARPQLASCFLLANGSDVTSVYKCLSDCAEISRYAGGIGFSCSDASNIVPMLRVFNATARCVDQCGKRKGSFAAYLEPWHIDVESFLDLRRNGGLEEDRARDLFLGLWVPDLFMRRVESNSHWTLFSPSEAPGLTAVYGREFDELYESYEGTCGRVVRAQALWAKILRAQVETGTPYMMYKDACNAKSNQSHMGTIKCSNLCTEIVLYTSSEETAVCNLASIALPKCVVSNVFDFEALRRTTELAVCNLNRVIDCTFYPTPEARVSNLRHRPIGVGVQGLADVFQLLGMPFDSSEARALNKAIFETMYFAAVSASCDLAARDGPYSSYDGSPASRGLLQPDLWGVTPSDRWDWASLRARIAEYGLRNCALVAPMPTASSSSILGNNECFEAYTSNLYSRRVLAGEFTMVNRHLVRVLERHGMWTKTTRKALLRDGGSVRSLDFPEKDMFKTVWEIKQRVVLDHAIDRGAFVCHSQSMNVFLSEPSVSQLSSMHFYGWKGGLKTGMYYLRTDPRTKPIKITCDSCTA